jgi:hypothetical protein
MLLILSLLAPVLGSLQWHLINPSITTDDFVTAAFGKDTIVAFTKNRIFTAPTGAKTFVQVPYNINGTGYDLTWIDSCYYSNQSLFLAIGRYVSTAGQETLMVTSSPDAKTWTISNQFTLQWKFPSVACGANEVYLSTGVSVFQSIDGKAWKTRTPLAGFDRMSYLPDLGYYIGWSYVVQSLFTSDSTREVWNIHVGPPKFPFSNIVMGRGVWVIAGDGFLYWSTNLAGWSVSNVPLDSHFTFSGLSYSATLNEFVITAHNLTGLYVYQSSDGATWYSRTEWSTTRAITNIVSESVVYALGQTGMVLFSHDAIKWELLSGNFWTSVLWVVQAPSGVWYAPAVVKDSPEDKTVPLWMTVDGAVWNRSAVNASAEVLLFLEPPIRCKKSTTFLAYDTQSVYVSKDLANWEPMFSADYENLQALISLYSTGSGFVLTAAGPRTDELYTSTDDGATWQRVNMNLTHLYQVYPVNVSTWLEVQLGTGGYWFFVSRDSGKTWTNTSAQAPGVEVGRLKRSWLSNSKAVLHLGPENVTTASTMDLTTWTTQKMMVNSYAKWLVFQDTFYALDKNRTWASADGISWTMSAQPYYTEVIHTWGVSDDAIVGVGYDGVSISASKQ